jgi:hypothetical protein
MARLSGQNRRIEKEKKSWQRKQNTRDERKMLIIACEDEKSSKLYFEAIFNDLKRNHAIAKDSLVFAKRLGTDPENVVKSVLEHKDYEAFDERWVVIDRDEVMLKKTGGTGGFSEEQFNSALKNAKNNKPEIKVAYANPCFEIWVLLHYEYYDTAINREALNEKLESEKGYIKSELFTPLLDPNLQAVAIRNSKQLIQSWENSQGEAIPATDNPSTTIHKLVELLNGFKKTAEK